MYIKLILLCFYLFNAKAQALSSNYTMGTHANIRQLHAISSDFNAETGPYQTRVLSKYYYVDESHQLSWFAALHKCRELGGNLVHFRTKKELKETIRILDNRNCYWLDLTDYADQGQFISMSTGVADAYLQWDSVEPNNLGGNEHCVQLVAYDHKTLLMNDNQCDRLCHFICETMLPTQTNLVVW